MGNLGPSLLGPLEWKPIMLTASVTIFVILFYGVNEIRKGVREIWNKKSAYDSPIKRRSRNRRLSTLPKYLGIKQSVSQQSRSM